MKAKLNIMLCKLFKSGALDQLGHILGTWVFWILCVGSRGPAKSPLPVRGPFTWSCTYQLLYIVYCMLRKKYCTWSNSSPLCHRGTRWTGKVILKSLFKKLGLRWKFLFTDNSPRKRVAVSFFLVAWEMGGLLPYKFLLKIII